jgi:hypothetical protein
MANWSYFFHNLKKFAPFFPMKNPLRKSKSYFLATNFATNKKKNPLKKLLVQLPQIHVHQSLMTKNFHTTQFHTFNDEKIRNKNLYASTFEIIKATFWPQFWRFGEVIDVYVCWTSNLLLKVELQQTLIWECSHFVFNSSQVHQCTQYERGF